MKKISFLQKKCFLMSHKGFVISQLSYRIVTSSHKLGTNLLRRCPCICVFSDLSLKQKIKRSQLR